MNRLVCLVVPYFGKLPSYFPAFLKTCGMNPRYNWLIYTDDGGGYSLPQNVCLRHCTFECFRDKIARAFDFDICLPSPRKLCDFKPIYGYVLQEELRNFAYWGYCDLDMVFGSMDTFIPERELKKHLKTYSLGHLAIYENSQIGREVFMRGEGYRRAFCVPDAMYYDEWSKTCEDINTCVERVGYSINPSFPMFDVLPYKSTFVGSIRDVNTREWKRVPGDNHIFLWRDGHLFDCFRKNGEICRREVLYAHFQKRRFNLSRWNEEGSIFYIAPNQMVSCESSEDDVIERLLRRSKVRSLAHLDESSHAFRESRVGEYLRAAGRRIGK